jgi:hypothetical protein
MNAIGFLGMNRGWPFSAKRVSACRYIINVYRVHANRIATEVIGMASRGYSVNEHSKGYAVGVLALAVMTKSAITAQGRTNPNPTRHAVESYGGINFESTKKAGEQFAVYWNTVRINLHGLFSLKLDRLCSGLRGVTNRAALLFYQMEAV